MSFFDRHRPAEDLFGFEVHGDLIDWRGASGGPLGEDEAGRQPYVVATERFHGRAGKVRNARADVRDAFASRRVASRREPAEAEELLG
ncbi:hypothetical protein ASF38_14790 [Aeromicrobium sp. Leaf272]|nr:hypothetical protein ASF38_14790 [Aeromicrobium sp. Leaf272]